MRQGAEPVIRDPLHALDDVAAAVQRSALCVGGVMGIRFVDNKSHTKKRIQTNEQTTIEKCTTFVLMIFRELVTSAIVLVLRSAINGC